MKIEAVVTCVSYSDFLAETLPHNRSQFDKLVVVTAPEDTATRKICEAWNVQCIPTDAFETRWGNFNKGKAVNIGLAALSKTDWIVHMDADIMLPVLTRAMLEAAKLDPQCLYGMDRHMVPNYECWREFMCQPPIQQEGWNGYADCGRFIHPDKKFPIGTRVAHPSGYVPIGFFQMWNAASGSHPYPEQHTDAARGDMMFALQWPRSQRHMIPEVICYHLESEPSPMGANWSGRKTKPFGGSEK